MNKIFMRKLLLLVLVSGYCAPATYGADKSRHALVIGNSIYESDVLPNVSNDADAVAGSMKKLKFDSTLKLDNATRDQMHEVIIEFGKQLEEDDDVGLFYYAGHAFNYRGLSYLMPSDFSSKLQEENGSIKNAAINLHHVLKNMSRSRNRLNIVILDSCRNIPDSVKVQDIAAGLGVPPATNGDMYIVYSAQPGQVAADGAPGGNSIFTGALVKNLDEEGLELKELFDNVSLEVTKQSKQQPSIVDRFAGEFFFAKKKVIIRGNF